MDNITDSIRRSIRKASPAPLPAADVAADGPFSAATAATSSSKTWSEYFASFTWKFWAVVIFVMALMGLNIFGVLAKGTDEATGIFGPIFKKLAALGIGTSATVVNTTAQGARTVVDSTAHATDSALDKIQDATDLQPGSGGGSMSAAKRPSNTVPQPSPQVSGQDGDPGWQGQGGVAPTGAHPATATEPGFCYIGSSGAFRGCAPIEFEEVCMSGEIFPTQELCVNPNLRP